MKMDKVAVVGKTSFTHLVRSRAYRSIPKEEKVQDDLASIRHER